MSSVWQRNGVSALLCALVFSGSAFVPSQVAAQTRTVARDGTTCECVAARTATAVVRDVRGRILATQQNGLVPAQSNASILLPGRVVSGPQSSAVVTLGGDCSVRVGANSSIEIKRDDGRLCLALFDSSGGGVGGASGGTVAAGGTTVSPLIPLSLGGLALGGLIFAISDDDKPVSR